MSGLSPSRVLAKLPADLAGHLMDLCRQVAAAGGRAYLVGGAVRDGLLGIRPTELDVEVFGLDPAPLRALLEESYSVDAVGESFAVLKLREVAIDVSLPRRERKQGPGHRDFAVAAAPGMPIGEAALRRDFTINALLFDPLSGEIEDPVGGRADLESRRLRHTSERFREDPLRVLRGMQLCARFRLDPDPALVDLCRSLEMADVARERVFDEWRKLLLLGVEISRGLRFVEAVGWLRFFPELEALVGCEQDPRWHPEGDAWVHTCHVMDAFACRRLGDDHEDLVVGLACLCHDLGKPATTRRSGGRIRSIGHEAAGREPTERLLARLTARTDLVAEVLPLVVHHLKPRQLYDAKAGDAAVRRLANKVGRIDRLVRVARADAWGRPPLRGDDDASGPWLLDRAEALALAASRPRPLVLGRHLVARGLDPGPGFGPLLDACFEAQLEGRFADLEGGLAFLDDMLAARNHTPSTAEDGAEIKDLPGSS
ncbi:MAG: HD domain-containing protein [Thermoanaerobaculia bacterium]|nr:HD domain-containing protein [Thermoanaerobaculia bacterium]